MPSNQLKLFEQEVLLTRGPQSSNSLAKLDISVDLSSKASTISTSKSQVEKMSVTSGKTPSLFSGLSGLEEPSSSEIEYIFDSAVSSTSTSKSQTVRSYNHIFINIISN